MANCRWYSSPDVPGGRYLVPGCWNRAVYGDDADCHCPLPPKKLTKAMRDAAMALAALNMDRDQMEEAIYYIRRLANTGDRP